MIFCGHAWPSVRDAEAAGNFEAGLPQEGGRACPGMSLGCDAFHELAFLKRALRRWRLLHDPQDIVAPEDPTVVPL